MIAAMVASLAAAFQPAPCDIDGAPPAFEQEQRVECGWVAVPLREGSERTIRLWVAVVHGIGPEVRDDPVLYINGGPGIATVDSVLPNLPTSKALSVLRTERDLILFDQRGSGRSEEVLCPSLAATLNGIESAGLHPDAEEERKRIAVSDCRSELDRSGTEIVAYSTSATVADIEALRLALGVKRWNLVSVSYGTLVAMHAMHAMRTNPSSIRSVILNSPYPPNSVAWAEQASTAAAAYSAIDRACADDPGCYGRFGSLVPKLEATLDRLEREPLQDGEGSITGRQFASALWPLAVSSSTVRFVPLAISRAHAGDENMIKRLVARFAGGDSFGQFSPAQALAISCPETGRTREWYARARALYPELVSPAPDDSWDRFCAAFRPGFVDPSFFAPVASDIPTLIYAGSLDASVPVVDAYQALRFLARATLVEVADVAHAPMGTDDCTRSLAVAFLDQPDAALNLECLAQRAHTEFATSGLDDLLTPAN